MNLAIEARKLADYIQQINLATERDGNSHDPYKHIGALYTNVVLQAGLNYRTVVQPRVLRILTNYPDATTVNAFLKVIERDGMENVLNWKHVDKIDRMYNLLAFSTKMSINTCDDMAVFLRDESNQQKFLTIRGMGNKTLDYTLKLLSFDTIAVDRHIYSFIEQAGLSIVDYKTTKRVVEFAADILEVSRSAMDYSIWLYMSTNRNRQTTIKF